MCLDVRASVTFPVALDFLGRKRAMGETSPVWKSGGSPPHRAACRPRTSSCRGCLVERGARAAVGALPTERGGPQASAHPPPVCVSSTMGMLEQS